jgi:hypothetical protein
MLVIDTSINREKIIDTIMINRLEDLEDPDSIYTYIIRKPKGFEDIPIKHKYSDGYLPLLKQAVDIIIGAKK